LEGFWERISSSYKVEKLQLSSIRGAILDKRSEMTSFLFSDPFKTLLTFIKTTMGWWYEIAASPYPSFLDPPDDFEG
jgi:hypothetical protein